jgi:lipid II:glycine glycyltransferase (peptidoglycan interpeptide bridge formation enzyme)
LADYISQDSMYVQYNLYKRKSFVIKIDRYNKSTVVTKLNKDIELILKEFAPNHKGSIKKAIKEGLTTKILHEPEEIIEFAKNYSAMYKARKLTINEDECVKSFLEIAVFFDKYKKGYFLGVMNSTNELIGGVIIINQGTTALYSKGYSDIKHRQLPISHIGLFEAMKIAQKEDRTIFDFGGYNFLVDENDQITKVNFFKSGFSKDFLFYPHIMYFRLNIVGYYFYDMVRGLKRWAENFKEKYFLKK